MNLKTTKLRDAITFALVAGTTSLVGTGVAVAQDSQQATTLDRIQVTGSRIRQVDVETQQPVLVLSREAIQQTGRTSVADVLQQIAVNGAAINTQFNNGGNGSAGVDLRNLGSARTLVLVNGRRWVSALDGTVDLNTIPSAMVERIEVLKDGASSIYGSDAIAGVVNLILRENYEGVEARSYYGQFSQGDGSRETHDVTVGINGDRGNLTFGASYTKEGAVSAGDRRISRDPVIGRGALQYSPTTPSGRLWDLTIDGVPTDDYAAWSAASVESRGINNLIIDPGADGRDLSEFRDYSTADNYNFAPDNFLRTPQERRSVFVQGIYDLSDRVSFRTDALYNQRISAQQLAGFPLGEGSYLSGRQGLLPTSYYNPTNGTADARELNWSRRLTEQSRFYEQDVKTFHWYGGLEGTFDIGNRFFAWDVGYSYNANDRLDTEIGDINVGNLALATGASFLDSDGVVRCGTPGAVIDGCVPFNPFSNPGELTQAQVDYLLFTAKDAYRNTSRSFTANISGELFELPGGSAGFAAGVERRKEFGYDNPDAFVSAGMTSGNARQPTSGGYDLNDAYVELLLPVLADVPFAQQLEFSFATRYSDYSNFGDTLNSKAGFKWKPFEDLMIRGNWAQGFRAPSISNLFGGASASYDTYGDPCSIDSPYYGNQGVAERCAAAGIPTSYTQRAGYGAQTAYPLDWVSNQNLAPETATNRTLGFVYSPSFIQNFDVSLDWWRINIDDAISRPSITYILDQCFVEADAGWCAVADQSEIVRNSLGEITYFARSLRNLGAIEVEGFDMTTRYSMPETDFGSFAFVWDSSYMSSYRTKATPDSDWGDSSVGRYSQSSPTWRLRSNFNINWNLGDFGMSWSARYYSSMVENCRFPAVAVICSDPTRRTDSGAAPRNRLGSVTYHDVQGRYNLPWNSTVKLGVNNLFEKEPPLASQASANTFDPQYETPGRFYYMEYVQRF